LEEDVNEGRRDDFGIVLPRCNACWREEVDESAACDLDGETYAEIDELNVCGEGG
jgi:hypothetical protein